MKVLAGLVTQGTGSLGGMTMSKNKQGYYLRSRTVPSNPRSIRQTGIRNTLSALAATWATLTAAQQAGWNLYGKNVQVVLDNGQTKILSGFNWFVGSNQLQILAGGSAVLTPPDIFTLAGTPFSVDFEYLTSSTSVLNFSLLNPPVAAGTGDQVLVQIGRPQTLGTQYFSGPWQYVDVVDSIDQGTSVVLDLSSASDYLASSNNYQWIRLTRILPDGRYSTPVHFGPIVGGASAAEYDFADDPWVANVDGNADTVNHDLNSAGNLVSVTDQGGGSDHIAFSLTSVSGQPRLTLTSSFLGAGSTGAYSTDLLVGGSLGYYLLHADVTWD